MPEELIHVWHRCHGCGARPLVGRRYSCETCPAGPDNDLCERCYAQYRVGHLEHPAKDSFAASLRLGEHVFSQHEGEPGAGYRSWLAVPAASAEAPHVADGFVLRPELRAGDASFLGSYAFVAILESRPRPLVFTALHVLDELIKKHGVDATEGNDGYSGRELPALVTEVRLYDVFAERWILAEVGTAAPMLVLPDARTGEEEPFCQRDLAAFEARPSSAFAPGRWAAEPPEVGDPLWLAARPKGQERQRTLGAVVVESGPRALVYRFTDAELEAPFSSGAPVLDRRGAIVGVNVGGGRLEGRRFGHACHVASVRRHLAGAPG